MKKIAQVVGKNEMPKEISPGKIRRMVHGNDGASFVRQQLIRRTIKITNKSTLTVQLHVTLV